LHLVRDDLGRIPIVAVPILPLTRAQTPLDIDLRALAQVLGRDLGQPAEHRDVMPLRALLLLAGFPVLPGVGRRDTQVRDGAAARHVARLGIGAQVTDQNDFIDASGHRSSCVASGWTVETAGRGARTRALYDVGLPFSRSFLGRAARIAAKIVPGTIFRQLLGP